ncbi:hypothetical protein LKD70_03915 [Ruminococcus sp. CLA-AA-H200]|uniref:Uncharacterized protein n=1 Tax=Ruminococcus turbiniformis TaxID=2881258 RepID=A0ABS8FU89_9FIRM|nr:hypothetical protein [Ruminococcus turbiniformis]MCC2253590.1 hypothetical protein [Ruminococcus turbiniformis]
MGGSATAEYSAVPELGDILYQLDNWDVEIPDVCFFGERAKEFLKAVARGYIQIHLDELIDEYKMCSITIYRKDTVTLTVAEAKKLIAVAYREEDPDEEYAKLILQISGGKSGRITAKDIKDTALELNVKEFPYYAPENIEF